MMVLPTSPCVSCSSEDSVTSSGEDTSPLSKKHGIGLRHMICLMALAGFLVISLSVASTFKTPREGDGFLAMVSKNSTEDAVEEHDRDIETDSEALEDDSAVVALPHHAAGHVHPHHHPAEHAARVDNRMDRRTARRVIHHVDKTHPSDKSGSALATTSLPPCQAPAALEEGEEGEADHGKDNRELEKHNELVALSHHAAGHAQPPHHPAAHVARVDNRMDRRTARRVIQHVDTNHPSDKSGSAPATTSLPPCQAPSASKEGEKDEADHGKDVGELEKDSEVVAFSHHAAGHAYPHNHPAAHVARVDNRMDRRTAGRVTHHVEKLPSDKSGSAPVTTSLPPCLTPVDAKEEEDGPDNETGSGEIYKDSAVVAHAHPHPVAHHERMERSKERRVIHHAAKNSGQGSGSAPATTTFPPCQVNADQHSEASTGDDSKIPEIFNQEVEERNVHDDDSKTVIA